MCVATCMCSIRRITAETTRKRTLTGMSVWKHYSRLLVHPSIINLSVSSVRSNQANDLCCPTPHCLTVSRILQCPTPHCLTVSRILQCPTPHCLTVTRILQCPTPHCLTVTRILQCPTPHCLTVSSHSNRYETKNHNGQTIYIDCDYLSTRNVSISAILTSWQPWLNTFKIIPSFSTVSWRKKLFKDSFKKSVACLNQTFHWGWLLAFECAAVIAGTERHADRERHRDNNLPPPTGACGATPEWLYFCQSIIRCNRADIAVGVSSYNDIEPRASHGLTHATCHSDWCQREGYNTYAV